MKPKLKNDTLYIPSPEGVYFLNNRGAFTLRGNSVHRWLEHLEPYLDGNHTLEDITQGLPADKKEMVFGLVNFLTEKGFIKDAGGDKPHTLNPAEESAYASEIAFIDYFRDSAAYTFQLFRESRILVLGSGLTITALVQANLHSGVRQVHVMTSEECVTERGRYRQYLEAAKERDPRQTLNEELVDQWPGDESAVRAAIKPFDAVIHVSDKPMLDRAKMLNRICLAEDKVFIQAVVVGDRAWIGPLVAPGNEKGCWECAWRRLQANHGDRLLDYEFQNQLDLQVSEFLTAPTAAMVSNQLSFEIFKYLTGAGPLEAEGRMIAVDLETIQSQTHRFYPHPLCSAHHSPVEKLTEEMFIDTIHRLEQGKELEAKDFSERVAARFDEELGLFSKLDEYDFVQLPLNISQVTVSNPMVLPNLSGPIIASEVGKDLGNARQRATQRACEIYAASVVDGRQLPSVGDEKHRQSAVRANGLLGDDETDLNEGWAWGYDPNEGRAHLVPAESVFPTLRGEVPSKGTSPGLASGFSWSEAVSKALISHCNRLTVAELEATERPFLRIDLMDGLLDADGVQYKRMLNVIGEEVAVYDVTSKLRVPTFAFCVGDRTLTYVSHVDGPAALKAGLEQTLQQHQRVENRPWYDPPLIPDLPIARRGSIRTVEPEYGCPREWPERQKLLQNTLESCGWRTLIVPLDHDPAITDALPYLVNVVLVQDG